MATKPTKLLRHPIPYKDLTTPEAARRVTQQLRDITDAVNAQAEMKVSLQDGPKNFQATFSGSYAALSWDPIDVTLRKYLDGARIWRVALAADGNLDFYQNHSRTILVDCIRTTRYVDVEVSSGTGYIYWVQWMNLDGDLTSPAGGLSGTIS